VPAARDVSSVRAALLPADVGPRGASAGAPAYRAAADTASLDAERHRVAACG